MLSNRLGNVRGNYQVEEVIISLEKYKAEHVKQYNDAVVQHNKKILSYLQKAVKLAEQGKLPKIPAQLGLPPPINQEKEYEEIIKLFKLSTDMDVQLSFTEADGVFNNNWEWVRTAHLINSTYSGMGAETFFNEANSSYTETSLDD